jgi:hypothetical protein
MGDRADTILFPVNARKRAFIAFESSAGLASPRPPPGRAYDVLCDVVVRKRGGEGV